MKIINEQIELEGTQYYKIICLISKQNDSAKWLARVRVLRKDTGEYIKAGFTIFDKNKEIVINNVNKRVNESLILELERSGAPPDWNNDVRCALLYCQKLHREIMSFGEYSMDILSSQKNSDGYLSKYAIFWKSITKKSVFLSKKIESLNAKERIDLLTLSEDSLKDPSNTWSLEDIDLRIMVFDFFANPSSKEMEYYDLQKKKLASRFKELGWTQ
ncbi:MAG: hypothetical protein ACRBBR_13920 [Cellvibrionaceae bacterium]